MTHSATTASTRGAGKPAGLRIATLAAFAAATLASPSHAAKASDALAVNDPFEKANRRFYASHEKFERAIIRPLAHGYETVVPKPVRDAVHNLFTEIGEPMVFANDMVQLRFARAVRTAARFAANATIGVGGLMDPATRLGLPHHDNSFGDTLGRYGVTAGPYLYLPLLGPTDFRDAIGMAVDYATNPVGWGHYRNDWLVRSSIWIVGGLDSLVRAEPDLEAIENNTDPYASMRSFYLQNREAEIHGNAPIKLQDLPQFDDELEPPPAGSSAPASPAPANAAPPSAAGSAAPTSALVAGPSVPGASGDVAAFLLPSRAGRLDPPRSAAPIEL